MKSIEHLKNTYHSVLEHKLKGISDGEIAAHFHLLPERYFVNKSQAEIIQHILMINDLRKTTKEGNPTASLLPMIEWKDAQDQSYTEVTIVSEDQVGLFYKLAGAFSLAGLNILSAKAISRSDNIAIDTFYVSEANGGFVRGDKAKDIFYQVIDEVLVMNTDLSHTFLARSCEEPFFDIDAPTIEIASLEPRLNSVEVYQEISQQRTKIEVHTRDKIGLLFFLAKTISDHGYNITFARINTERGIATDTFHITALSGQTDPDRLHDLRTALLQAIALGQTRSTLLQPTLNEAFTC